MPRDRHDDPARSIAATLRIPRAGERLAPLPTGLALSVLDGPDVGTHRVAGNEINVGRGQGCDVRLTDASISEFHFKLSLGDAEILLEDLDSRNGVWVGRARIQRASLLPGAVFRAGSCGFRLDAITTETTAITERTDFYGVSAVSAAMRSVFALLGRAAKTPLPILITGETGCGKGMMARAIHRASERMGSFVTLDCTALPREMAEGLVLGHVKGAFTGAHRDRPSPFEEAHGGTLFLDEIGELPLELQPKLLRVVDEQVVQRVGSHEDRRVDVRIIAATNRDLVQQVSAQQFRADLYHRLAGIPVRVPPLRARRDDALHLAQIFLNEMHERTGTKTRLSSDAMTMLERLPWPGNVRELRQTIQRAAYLVDGETIEKSDLLLEEEEPRKAVVVERHAGSIKEHDGGREDQDTLRPLDELVEELRLEYCTRLLAVTNSTAEAAAIAGYSPRGLRLLLGRLGLPTVHPSRATQGQSSTNS